MHGRLPTFPLPMAHVLSFADAVRQRREQERREIHEACVRVIELNLRCAVSAFAAAPETERPVRARQIRQLAELLEYVVAR